MRMRTCFSNVCLYLYCPWRFNKKKVGWYPWTGLTTPHMCACPQSGFGFPTSYVKVIFMFNDLWWEMIVRFVDISRSVDHYCLNFLFYTKNGRNRKHRYPQHTNTCSLTLLAWYRHSNKKWWGYGAKLVLWTKTYRLSKERTLDEIGWQSAENSVFSRFSVFSGNLSLCTVSIMNAGRDRMIVGFITTCAISSYHC